MGRTEVDHACVYQVPLLLDGMSRPFRCAFIGAVLAFSAGAIVGLVLGLHHPPTVWFAVLELGVPAGILGALLGLAACGAVDVTRRPAASVRGRQTRHPQERP